MKTGEVQKTGEVHKTSVETAQNEHAFLFLVMKSVKQVIPWTQAEESFTICEVSF